MDFKAPVAPETFQVLVPEQDLSNLPDVPEHLDGVEGRLREFDDVNLLEVDTDLEAVLIWINRQNSPETKRAYRKEAERLLLWCHSVQNKPLSSLYPKDFLDYENFLTKLGPGWAGPRRKRTDPEWKPFLKPLSQKSATQALIIIKALLSFLVENGYLTKNALASRLKNRKSTDDAPGRVSFTQAEWDCILNAADEIPESESEEARLAYERGRWLVRLMVKTGLRISEVAKHTMGAFQEVESDDGSGEGKWKFFVKGKGDVKAAIPVKNDLLKALKRYRAHLGLTPLPSPSDQTPLIPNLREFTRDVNGNLVMVPVTSRRLHQVLKKIMLKAGHTLQETHPHRAEKLLNATPHMIRHTAVTEVGKVADIRVQQAFARHKDIRTTMIYNHTEDDAVFDALENAKI